MMYRMTLARHWLIDPDVVFLNHGSFGACPRAVLDAQNRLRARMERQPLQFLARDLEGLFDEARATLADFVGADAGDLAFVPNVTSGVNAVLRSIPIRAGDEVLVTDQAYGACRNALDFAAGRAGATVRVVPVPFPLAGPDDVLEAVVGAVGPRTRLALLDHVSSPTGVVFPLARLVAELAARGADTLVDGAHAPGMLPLDLRAIGAAYYAGNCHKWLCAPKGAAFLHVRRDRQAWVRPLTISHGATSPRTDRSRFHLEFDWTGSDDPTAYLCVAESIRFLGALLPGGWPALMAENHALALEARDVLGQALGVAAPTPDDMIGALAALPLPDGPSVALQETLLARFGIEVPIIPWPLPPGRLVRVSCQLYNTRAQYERLATALVELGLAR
jgi:isopenicillin-N epimerase